LETLEAWLEAEEQLPSRERRTAQRLYEALCLEGYPGAVDAVRRHQREFERRRHPTGIHLRDNYFALDVLIVPGSWREDSLHAARAAAQRATDLDLAHTG
jgi:hypothetical protein